MTDIDVVPQDIITDDYMARTATPRDRLRGAILNVEEESGRLAALLEARDRARTEGYQRRSQCQEAEARLREANKTNSQTIAYKYLNQDGALAEGDPIADLKQLVADALADIQQMDEIEAALEAEIQNVQLELRELKRIQYRLQAEFILDSEEYAHLLAQHKDAWLRLRSVKAALRMIAEACHGQMPSPYDTVWNVSEPLEKRLNFPLNEGFIECWAETLAELERTADVELPMFG